MEQVVSPHLVRAVRQTLGVAVVRAGQQQFGGVGGTSRDHHDVGGEPLLLPVDQGQHAGDGPAAAVGVQAVHLGVAHQRHIRVFQCGPDGDDLGVGLGVDQAGEPVTGRAADAPAVRRVGLVQQDPARGVERVQPNPGQIVEQLLNTGLVTDRWERVGAL